MIKISGKKLLFAIIFTFLIFNIIACNTTNSFKSKTMKISQYSNGSSGECWSYEFSKEGVLEEEEYYTSRFFLNFGPGYRENWIFKSVGEGEVTVYWIKYSGGCDIVESECYEVIYTVDSAGNISVKDQKFI